MASPKTKTRMLDAAERLFAAHGIAGTSLRAVTGEAGVNLAAVHYHFGTKDALLREVFARRVGPVNEARLARLDALEASAGGRPLAVEAIFTALLAPVIEQSRADAQQGHDWRRMVGRVYAEPVEVVEPLLRQHFAEIERRFTAALARALPDLPAGEIAARLSLVVGVLTHVLAGQHEIALRQHGEVPSDAAMIARVVGFCAAGFRAPVAAPRAGARRVQTALRRRA